MQSFKIVPSIEKYHTFKEYASSITFNNDDFILCSKGVYEKYLKDYLLKEQVFFRSNYGSGEPNSDMVDSLLSDFLDGDYKRIIAIGGGSVMDMAKYLAVATKADIHDIYQNKDHLKHLRELILIPTTCGSGSEVSNIAIVEMLDMKTKLGLAIDPLYADKAILISELLDSMSDFYLLTSAIDGLVHAIESYLSKRSNIYTRLFQEKAIELYLKNFIAYLDGGRNNINMEELMIASNMAGISFANTGTGCVHAISYPLSGAYHVTHGLANAIFLCEVLKMYDQKSSGGSLDELKALIAKNLNSDKDVLNDLDHLLHSLFDIPRLHTFGMKEEEIESFSKSVILNQQRLMSNGYVNLELEDLMLIYKSLY